MVRPRALFECTRHATCSAHIRDRRCDAHCRFVDSYIPLYGTKGIPRRTSTLCHNLPLLRCATLLPAFDSPSPFPLFSCHPHRSCATPRIRMSYVSRKHVASASLSVFFYFSFIILLFYLVTYFATVVIAQKYSESRHVRGTKRKAGWVVCNFMVYFLTSFRKKLVCKQMMILKKRIL